MISLMLAMVASAAPQELELKSLKFVAPVNVKAFTVKGSAESARISAELAAGKLMSLSVIIPTSALTTGIGMRDTHMRERIFTAEGGAQPDLEFRASGELSCAQAAECEVPGVLKIQGKEQPLTLKTKLEISGEKLKASGKGEVLLSKYGIALPEHLGVKVQEPVLIEFEAQSK